MFDFVGLPPSPIPLKFMPNCSLRTSKCEQFGMNINGPRRAGKIVPQPLPSACSFYVIFPHLLSFHLFSWICKWVNIHKGPLDEWTCQIVKLIISKHATMTILGWNQPIYILMISPFLVLFIIIHEYSKDIGLLSFYWICKLDNLHMQQKDNRPMSKL